MISNPLAASGNPRLKRIEAISRIVKFFVIAILIIDVSDFIINFDVWVPLRNGTRIGVPILNVTMKLMLYLWYVTLARLFHFYQRGLIFSAQTTRHIKALGILCVAHWLLASSMRLFFPSAPPQPYYPVPPGFEVHLVRSNFGASFFYFNLGGINLGMLLAGLVIVIIAWIMEEGRKIQEEQALTV